MCRRSCENLGRRADRTTGAMFKVKLLVTFLVRAVTGVCVLLGFVFDTSMGFWTGLMPDVSDDAGIDVKVFSVVGSELVIALTKADSVMEGEYHEVQREIQGIG